MQAWSLLFLYLAGATSPATTLDQIVGEYVGIRPGMHEGTPWSLSIHSDGTCRSVLKHPTIRIVFDGEVKIEADRVAMESTLNLEASGFALDAPVEAFRNSTMKFIPVSWGKRTYLIQDNQADWFIRDVVRGSEPRLSGDGVHLLRVGDWKVRVWSRPEVPEDWKKSFPPDNFSMRVARQLEYHRAEIDAGSRNGLAAGMLLTLFSSKYGATDLRGVSVTADTAVIENAYGDPPLTKGTRVYSRIPDTVETRGR
jgi:hypothetical protein